jgi:hypothetical protein
MAYNKDQQTKKMSYSFGTFYSSDKKGNEFQLVKLGFYDGRLTFNFLKGTSGGGGSEGGDAYMSIDRETACLLKQYLDVIIRNRIERFRNGLSYDDIYVTYNITFVDKDSHELRSAGNITFKTFPSQDSSNNTVHLLYTNGTNEYDITLGNPFIAKAFSHSDEYFAGVDKNDDRLYALAWLINDIVQCWPIIIQNDKIGSIVINRMNTYFNAIFNKMGIPLPENTDGGKYQEKYRSGKGGESNLETGEGGF